MAYSSSDVYSVVIYYAALLQAYTALNNHFVSIQPCCKLMQPQIIMFPSTQPS